MLAGTAENRDMATSRSDRIKGTSGVDKLSGKGGDDVIFGYDGHQKAGTTGQITAERIGSGFDGAVFAGSAPGRPDELFVVQKNQGLISILDPATGSTKLFLDIPDAELSTAGEQGLLGLAFHPGYQTNGRFYVHLVNAAGDIEIREYQRSAGDPASADPASLRTIITIPHPTFGNHNGGALAFGPDGYLYVALGDGGGGNDPAGNGQNTDTLLGAILRIDIDGDAFPADAGRNYAIPADNPFVGSAGADEIWAYGLRNPWRISFDKNGDLYIADVGQSAREEVDFQPAHSPGGVNYGWDAAEGTLGNPPAGSVLPIFEYGHDLGKAITGGYVVRGGEASMEGAYVFGDFASGRIWTLVVEGGTATSVVDRTGQVVSPDAPFEQIASFGIDGHGALYAVSLGGDIFRLDMSKQAGDVGDILRGGRGDDRVFGGPGDDRLFGNGGHDRLSGGFGDDILKGGFGDDRLVGHQGSDILRGGRGSDVLKGGADADTFVFDTRLDSRTNVDRIADFVPGTDVILLKQSVFASIGADLDAGEFRVGARAREPDDHILYAPADGSLYYDANGSGHGRRTLFARLDAGSISTPATSLSCEPAGGSFHRKVEIGVGIGFVGEGEVPPFVGIGLEAMQLHQARQQEPVGARLARLLRVVRPGAFGEEIEAGAHVDLDLGRQEDQRQVGGRAAGMA